MRYKVLGESVVDTKTGFVMMTLSLPPWESTLHFECKVLNGLLTPKWDGDTLIWVAGK